MMNIKNIEVLVKRKYEKGNIVQKKNFDTKKNQENAENSKNYKMGKALCKTGKNADKIKPSSSW